MLKKEARKIVSWTGYELHEHPMIRFFIVFVFLLGYFIFTSFKFGMDQGFLISLLTWSFFVLCTPIADAGVLFDLPLRIFLGVRMIFSELFVWLFAISLNIVSLLIFPSIYDATIILSLFQYILSHPLPYWGIVLLSALGTFMSVLFGDELIDVASEQKDKRHHHKNHKAKHHLLLFIFLIILVLILYDFLLHKLGIAIPLL